MKENSDLHVGMKLYREIHKRGFAPEIKEYTISKIARKYIYLSENDRYPIDKTSLTFTDPAYSQNNFKLYRSENEIKDMWETNRLFNKIKASFNGYYVPNDLNLEKLRQIDKILSV